MSARRRIARFSRPVRRITRRVADLWPLTPLGLALAVLCPLWLEVYGQGEGDLVITVVGYAGLALVALSVLLVTAGALHARFRRVATVMSDDDELRMDTHRPTPSGYSTGGFRFLPLLQVTFDCEKPSRLRSVNTKLRGRFNEKWIASRRGEVRQVTRRIVVQDILGLARLGVRRSQDVRVTILPHVGALRRLAALTSFAGGEDRPHPMGLEDGDRVDLRRYVPGDPARFIHWKVFGRTRRLMVRVPERALSRAERTLAYLVSHPTDGATAAVARVALEANALGADWVFAADGPSGDARTIPAAVEALVASADATGDAASGLAAFVERSERHGPGSVVVFAPPAPGPWVERVLAVARARSQGLRVIIGVDPSPPARPIRWWRRVVFSGQQQGTAADDLEAVSRALRHARVELVIFDRATGRQLGVGAAKRRIRAREAA